MPADKQVFEGGGQVLVSTDSIRKLGLYLAAARELIAAQRACIEARASR